MKIEFIKETNFEGGVVYYTKVDGYYVNNSLETNEEKAKEKYQLVIESKGTLEPVKEVIDSIEIEIN